MRRALIFLGLWLGIVSSAWAFLFTPPAPFVPKVSSGGSFGTPTSIGINTGASPLSISSATCGAGNLVVVISVTYPTGLTLSMTDSASNAYSSASSGLWDSNAYEYEVWYAPTIAALSSGSITLTGSGGSSFVMSALCVSGGSSSPLDTASTSSPATGTSTTPSVTSGTPAQSGELFIGMVGFHGATTFTQASGWSVPPTAENGGTSHMAGGYLINSGTGTKTYAPTIGASDPWVDVVVGFKHS